MVSDEFKESMRIGDLVYKGMKVRDIFAKMIARGVQLTEKRLFIGQLRKYNGEAARLVYDAYEAKVMDEEWVARAEKFLDGD